jgi:hypothetical protein
MAPLALDSPRRCPARATLGSFDVERDPPLAAMLRES